MTNETIEKLKEKLEEAGKLTSEDISQEDLLKQTELLIEIVKEMQSLGMKDEINKALNDPNIQKHTKIVEEIVKKQ